MLATIFAYFALPDGGYLLLVAGYSLELIHHAESDFRRWRHEQKSGCLVVRRLLTDLVLLSGLTLILAGYVSTHVAGQH